MCQGLPLGSLHLLDGLYGAGQKLWLQCAILHFQLERQMVLIIFALSFYTNFIFLLNLVEFFKYQKYGECSDYYRLFCFRQILFLMHSLLVLMKLSIYISGLSHEKVILQQTQCKKYMNWFATVLRVVICFIILTDLTEFFVEVLCG